MSNDSEQNASVENEKAEARENLTLANSTDTKLERRAAEIGEETLGEPNMEGWSAKEYTEAFYPPLIPEVALSMMRMIEESTILITTKEGHKIPSVDIAGQEFIEASATLGEKSLELLENCAVINFLINSSIKILADKPEDHLKLEEIGGGNTIYQYLALMLLTDSIIHAEYLKENREEIERWLNKEPTHDWSSYFLVFQAYFKAHPELYVTASPEIQARYKDMLSKTSEELEDDLRKKIKGVPRVDVFKENLGGELPKGDSDVVSISKWGSVELLTLNFCIESATRDMDEWRDGLRNATSRVALGGFLEMTAIRHSDGYMVGNREMPAVSIDADDLIKELGELGFEITIVSELTGSDKKKVGYDGMVFVLAKRIKKLEDIQYRPKVNS